MSLCAAIDHWGTTPDERARRFPCDDVLPGHEQALFRAVTVEAPPPVVFRWLCQMKLAPYSYDLIDNRGRRSPQHLVPGVEQLVVGERVLIFELASFAVDEHLTLVLRGHRVFGDVAMSYVVVPHGAGASRLVGKVAIVPVGGVAGAVLRHVLPFGDLVMMRRQLLNLKALAEATPLSAVAAAAAAAATPTPTPDPGLTARVAGRRVTGTRRTAPRARWPGSRPGSAWGCPRR